MISRLSFVNSFPRTASCFPLRMRMFFHLLWPAISVYFDTSRQPSPVGLLPPIDADRGKERASGYGLQMETPRDWHEDDRFWELAEPILFDENRWFVAQTEVDQILQLVRPAEGSTILDLCCGPGRHSLELARRGFNVTGVDRTARYLETAASKSGGDKVEWVHADARTFNRPDSFDYAFNLYTSFGYFEDADQDEEVARNVCQSLKPGGSLVIHTMGKEVIGKYFQERDWTEKGDLLLLDDRRLIPPFAAIENQWTLVTAHGRQTIGFVVRLYAASEMEALLRRAGFSRVRFFGGLDGMPYDQNARRLVAVAVK